MADSEKNQGKVEIKIGNTSFTAEGNEDWLENQLKLVIESATRAGMTQKNEDISNGKANIDRGNFTKSLASYIKEKNGETNQVQRFLATAAWLHHRDNTPLTSSLVSKTLKDNQQKRLANASDALNQNVKKGYCEKIKPEGFHILPEGWKFLGEGE